ncbi:MAG: HlyD family efflux transporter periplasmic adaptor subunit [Planctomycetota bacterium]
MRLNRPWSVLIALLFVSPIVIIWLIPERQAPELITVEKLPLHLDVKSVGVIEPVRTLRMTSQSLWPVQILTMVPEGTVVQKGDVVCELDASKLRDILREREVLVIKAKAALQAAQRQEELQQAGNERRLALAQKAVLAAEQDLRLYEEATFPQQLEKFDQDINLSDDQLALTEDDYAAIESLWALGIENDPVLAQASLKVTTQQETLRRLEGSRYVFEQFRHPRKKTQLNHQRTMSQLNLIRTELANSLMLSRTRIGTLSEERRVRIYERYAKMASDSIEACTLRAPCDGPVMYAGWDQRGRGSNPIEVGKTVYTGQAIFQIPVDQQMKVAIPLHETLITRVSRGMPVDVHVTGFVDQTISATITWISPYSAERNRYQPGERDYWLDVRLEPTAEQQQFLSYRMDATATISMLEHPDAIAVPREALTRYGDRSVVLMAQGNRLKACPVQPGEVVDGKVVIESGLHEGDQIVASISERQLDELKVASTAGGDHGD